MRVALVEDHAFIRELMSAYLDKQPRFQVVAQVGSAEEGLAACRELRPDLLILDISLPGASGIEALGALRRAGPPTMRVLFFSGSVDGEEIARALRAGPDGFVDKSESRRCFLEAVAKVAGGGNFYCQRSARVLGEMVRGGHQERRNGGALAAAAAEAAASAKTGAAASKRASRAVAVLTEREREVLGLVAGGRSTKQVAECLGLSAGTVVTHRANLMRKLDLHNAAGLTRFAVRHGIVPAR